MADIPSSSRRWLLQVIGVGSLTAVSGCNSNSEQSSESPSSTPEPDADPVIHEYSADPKESGTVLDVYMEAEGDKGIESAKVVYGKKKIVKQSDNTSVILEGQLDDVDTITPDSRELKFVVEDTAGNQTQKQMDPDRGKPNLTLSVEPTESSGEITLSVEAEDDIGLAEIELSLGNAPVYSKRVNGSVYSEEQTISVPTDRHFKKLLATGFAHDWNGNTAEYQTRTYTRKYDLFEETSYDIAAVYITQQGSGFLQHCRDTYEGTKPTVGIYDSDPIPSEVTDQHLDQMTGHGINRVLFDHAGKLKEENNDRVETFLDSPLIDYVTVEPFYVMAPLFRNMDRSWRDDILPRDLPLIRDEFLTLDNVATLDGRPVLSTWNFIALSWGEEREKVMEEFGDFQTLVDDIRQHVRLEDGTDPYLILGKGPIDLVDHDYVFDLVNQFDGITTWTPSDKDKQISWDQILDNIRATFRDNAQFAKSHHMEFTPTVLPGYNELGSACGRAGDKHIPRNRDRFRDMLDLAAEFATSDRINIATWNDWTEGTQIEPGTFEGNEYGTDYLDIITDFQRSDDG